VDVPLGYLILAQNILVTGAAGFIGSAVARQLLARGDHVIGLDNLNDYYDVQLKRDRLARLKRYDRYIDVLGGLEDKTTVGQIFRDHRPNRIINLAAQAGVRYSIESPQTYIDSNITGFLNILELVREYGCEQLVYASSSSVYGANSKAPFSVHDPVDHPLTIYAVTKRTNELMAHSYGYLFGVRSIGLRFFTVYGPWGRPDMALFKFTKAILDDEPIELYNNGEMSRDFTYVDDIVAGVVAVLDAGTNRISEVSPKYADPSTSPVAPFQLYNIGNSSPVELLDYVRILEAKLGKKATIKFLPMQPGDVRETWADVENFILEFDCAPSTTIEQGVEKFVTWYKSYYHID
jgi:UDP-glucuronate 4-epimerase